MINKLVLSGGGFNEICILGALDCLEHNNIFIKDIEYFAGSSAGAILSFFYVIGYTTEELKKEIDNINIKKLSSLSILNLLTSKGIDSGINIINWIKKMCKDKNFDENITLLELFNLTKKELNIVSTNLSIQEHVVFNYKSHPDINVILALRMSMAIPLIFTPVLYKGDYYVDGGITSNFPSFIFGKENEDEKDTIGILMKKNIIEINNFYDYMLSVLSCVSSKKYKEYKNIKTIVLKTEANQTLNYNLTVENINKLYDKGYKDCQEYFLK